MNEKTTASFVERLLHEPILVIVLVLGVAVLAWALWKIINIYREDNKLSRNLLVQLTKECSLALSNNTNAMNNNTQALSTLKETIEDGLEDVNNTIKNGLEKVIEKSEAGNKELKDLIAATNKEGRDSEKELMKALNKLILQFNSNQHGRVQEG